MPVSVTPRQVRQSASRYDANSIGPVVQYDEAELDEYHCPACQKLLFKARLMPGSLIETECRNSRCRQMTRQHGRKVVFSVA